MAISASRRLTTTTLERVLELTEGLEEGRRLVVIGGLWGEPHHRAGFQMGEIAELNGVKSFQMIAGLTSAKE